MCQIIIRNSIVAFKTLKCELSSRILEKSISIENELHPGIYIWNFRQRWDNNFKRDGSKHLLPDFNICAMDNEIPKTRSRNCQKINYSMLGKSFLYKPIHDTPLPLTFFNGEIKYIHYRSGVSCMGLYRNNCRK